MVVFAGVPWLDSTQLAETSSFSGWLGGEPIGEESAVPGLPAVLAVLRSVIDDGLGQYWAHTGERDPAQHVMETIIRCCSLR